MFIMVHFEAEVQHPNPEGRRGVNALRKCNLYERQNILGLEFSLLKCYERPC